MGDSLIATLAVILATGLLAEAVAAQLRLPHMLLLVGAGMALGPSLLGWVDVPPSSQAGTLVLSLGVSMILFDGGLRLSLRVLRSIAVGLALLALPGVVLTAAVTGVVAAAVFHVPLLVGMLIGAVLSPTDPAILIPLFGRLRLPQRLSQLIIAESAINDPVGAVLALAFAGSILSGSMSPGSLAFAFIEDLAVSTVLGGAFGVALAVVVSTHRLGVWRESAALAVLAVVTATYFSVEAAGGSGYLGAFIAGLVLGNMGELRLSMHVDHIGAVRAVVHTVTDLMVVLIFITVGAGVSFGMLAHHAVAAVAVTATLICLSRPLTVLVCALLDRRSRWTAQEIVFLAWTRETGVMPVALSGAITGYGIQGAGAVAISVTVALVATLTLQSTSKPWLARRLSLA